VRTLSRGFTPQFRRVHGQCTVRVAFWSDLHLLIKVCHSRRITSVCFALLCFTLLYFTLLSVCRSRCLFACFFLLSVLVSVFYLTLLSSVFISLLSLFVSLSILGYLLLSSRMCIFFFSFCYLLSFSLSVCIFFCLSFLLVSCVFFSPVSFSFFASFFRL